MPAISLMVDTRAKAAYRAKSRGYTGRTTSDAVALPRARLHFYSRNGGFSGFLHALQPHELLAVEQLQPLPGESSSCFRRSESRETRPHLDRHAPHLDLQVN